MDRTINTTGMRVGKAKYCVDTERTKAQAKAHGIVAIAVARGALTRGSCEVCASPFGAQAHHEDYSKPLEVRWLCRKHHMNRHSEIEGHTNYGVWRKLGLPRPVTRFAKYGGIE